MTLQEELHCIKERPGEPRGEFFSPSVQVNLTSAPSTGACPYVAPFYSVSFSTVRFKEDWLQLHWRRRPVTPVVHWITRDTRDRAREKGSGRGLQRDVVYLCWPIAPPRVRVQMRVKGGDSGSQPMSKAVHITWHGAQINFGDLPPYLNYGLRLDPSVQYWRNTSHGRKHRSSPDQA
jgi:hypothetical protein